ncbi:MAG: pyridoxal phosphate-dependent aminotransferase [Caldimicrobium sp.]
MSFSSSTPSIYPSHGGNIFYYAKKLGIHYKDLIDLSASVNPLVKDFLQEKLLHLWENLEFYPDPEGESLCNILAEIYSLERENFLLGHGSLELWQYFLLYFLPRGCHIFLPEPTFVGYRKILSQRKDFQITAPFSLTPEDHLNHLKNFMKKKYKNKAVILCHPNNPTGALFPKEELLSIIDKNPQVWFLIDEAFIEFKESASFLPHIQHFSNLYIFRSFTKFYGLAGTRLGYLAGNKKILSQLKKFLPTWNTDTLSQILAEKLLLDENFKKTSLDFFLKQKTIMEETLRALGVYYFPSVANFYLLKIEEGRRLYRWLLEEKRILVRSCHNFVGLSEDYLRVSLKRTEENQKFLEAIEEWLKGF